MKSTRKIHYGDYTTGWHKWFAWYPVEVYSWNGLKIDSKTTVWLEYVERKITYQHGTRPSDWMSALTHTSYRVNKGL